MLCSAENRRQQEVQKGVLQAGPERGSEWLFARSQKRNSHGKRKDILCCRYHGLQRQRIRISVERQSHQWNAIVSTIIKSRRRSGCSAYGARLPCHSCSAPAR